MRFYSCSLQDVLAMRVPAFWALVAQIPQLKAAEDLQFISAVGAAVWGNKDYVDRLVATASGDDDSSVDELDADALQRFKNVVLR
jgi:hypothetical protein